MPMRPPRRTEGLTIGDRLLHSAARRVAKRCAIRAGLEAIAVARAVRLVPAVAGRGLIFTLHHVRPCRPRIYDPNALLSVTPEFLDEAILAVKRRGLVPVHLDDVPASLADPSDARRVVCFTLDDGYRDNLHHAVPVFRKHAVPFTLFVTEGFVERRHGIWWETAEALTRETSSFAFDFGSGRETVPCRTRAEKMMAFCRLSHAIDVCDEAETVARIDAAARSAGIDPLAIVEEEVLGASELRTLSQDPLCRLGGHTVTHPNLSRLNDQRLAAEIRSSFEAVARYGGREPKSFAYPYGGRTAVSREAADAVLSAGFRLAVTGSPGVLRPASLHRPAELPRVSLNGHFQKPRYVDALVSGLPFAFRRHLSEGP